MTVKELIEALSEFDPDTEVFTEMDNGSVNLGDVYVRTVKMPIPSSNGTETRTGVVIWGA